MLKLSKHQIEVLTILYDGGIITEFEDGDVFLSNKDGDLFSFNKTTFKKLLYYKLIVFSYAPSIGVECFGNTNKANDLLNLLNQNKK